MKVKKLKNRNVINILISSIIFLFSLFVIMKSFSANKILVKGAVESISCKRDFDAKDTYSYEIKLEGSDVYRNRLNIPCDAISKVHIGGFIEVETEGHLFLQFLYEGQPIFDQDKIEMKNAEIIFLFYFILIISGIDLFFRIKQQQGATTKN